MLRQVLVHVGPRFVLHIRHFKQHLPHRVYSALSPWRYLSGPKDMTTETIAMTTLEAALAYAQVDTVDVLKARPELTEIPSRRFVFSTGAGKPRSGRFKSKMSRQKVFRACLERTKVSRTLLKASKSVLLAPQSVPKCIEHSWRPRHLTLHQKGYFLHPRVTHPQSLHGGRWTRKARRWASCAASSSSSPRS